MDGATLEPRLILASEAPSRARQFVAENDVVISGVRVYLRNIARVPRDVVDVASTAFSVLRPTAELDPAYLLSWVTSDIFISWLVALQRGNSPPAVLDADVRSQLIPLPSTLNEQRRIASSIDALLEEIADGEAALVLARTATQTYRQSLLKAAVTGELTADWRAANPQAETGQDLLDRILAARRTRWDSDPKNRLKKYVEPRGPEAADLPSLPPSWTWASLGQVAFVSGGATVDKKRKPVDPVEVPYLRVANVQRGSLDLSKLKTIVIERAKLSDLTLAPGDILLNEGGDRDKVGRGWVWEGQVQQCVHQNHVFKARPVSDLIEPRLTSIYLNELGRKFFFDASKHTTNLASISLTKIALAPVAVPPRDEATAIIAALESMSVDDHGDVGLRELRRTADVLRQSLLATAFRGELINELQA